MEIQAGGKRRGRPKLFTQRLNRLLKKGCGKVFPSTPARGVMFEPNRENTAALKFPGAENFAGPPKNNDSTARLLLECPNRIQNEIDSPAQVFFVRNGCVPLIEQRVLGKADDDAGRGCRVG